MDTFKGMFSGESARDEDALSLNADVVFEAEDDEEAELLDNNSSLVLSRTEAEMSQAAYHAQFMSNRLDGETEEEEKRPSSSGKQETQGQENSTSNGASFGDALRGGLTEQDVEDLDLKAKIAARALEDAKAAAVAEAQAEKESREEAAKANAAANDAKVADAILTFLRRSGVNVLKVMLLFMLISYYFFLKVQASK